MGRNKKGDRFLLTKTNLARAFARPNPDFHDTWMLVYAYATASDKLSRRNILNAEAYAYKLRQIPEWQTPENIERMVKIDEAILRAKERLANRKSRKELLQEKAERRAERKARQEPPRAPVPDKDPSELWAQMLEEKKL